MSATTRTTSEQTEAPAVESSSSSLPQGIKDIMAAMPRYQVVNITKEDIEAEGRIWEPKVPFAGLDYHHVVLQEFYETNIFQPTTDEVTWLFLDKLGPERAKMLRNLYIHANQEFEDGTWVGIDGRSSKSVGIDSKSRRVQGDGMYTKTRSKFDCTGTSELKARPSGFHLPP